MSTNVKNKKERKKVITLISRTENKRDERKKNAKE